MDSSLVKIFSEIVYYTELVAVFWAPFILIPLAYKNWVNYAKAKWYSEQKKVLIEVKLPQEMFRSPAAMELILTALHQTGGEGTIIDRYYKGKSRPWFSLEIASLNGEVRFFIWTFKDHKNFLEANLYAQYPDVAITEVEDYTNSFEYDMSKNAMWGCEFELAKPDAYPIKTYVDYGIKDDTEEEYKIDPLAPLIEFLGTIKKDQAVWVQIVVRAHTQEKTLFNAKAKEKILTDGPGMDTFFNGKEADPWKDGAKAEIKKILEATEIKDKDGNKVPNSVKLTEGQKDMIKALERSVSKYAFDVGIRAVHIGPKETFDKGAKGGIMGGFKNFGSENLNGFKPAQTGYDYMWQDPFGKKEAYQKEKIFNCFKERSFFHYPYIKSKKTIWGNNWKRGYIWKKKVFVLNTEELATIYHFPGSAIRTPSLRRIPSKRADAPANLPI